MSDENLIIIIVVCTLSVLSAILLQSIQVIHRKKSNRQLKMAKQK